MTMIADILLKKVSYPYLFYIGMIPMLIAFFAVTLLSHYENWDPILEILCSAYNTVCQKAKIRFHVVEQSEQTEALIGINNNEHEA